MARPRKEQQLPVEIIGPSTDGRYHGFLTVGEKPNGRPDRRHRSGKTYDDVEARLKALQAQFNKDEVPQAGTPPTVEKWLTHWVENIVPGTVSYSTERSYRLMVSKANRLIGGWPLTKLTPDHIEAMFKTLEKEGLSASSICTLRNSLRPAFAEAVRRGRLKSNAMAMAKPPKADDTEIEPLTAKEAKAVLSYAEARRNGTRWSVALSLGMRQGEALALRWVDGRKGDVDLEKGIVWVREKIERRTWEHGCDDPHRCGYTSGIVNGKAGHSLHQFEPCKPGCKRHQVYKKGEKPQPYPRGCPKPCPKDCTEHARNCPEKTGGGLVRGKPKSRAGKRAIALPPPLIEALRKHKAAQAAERLAAGTEWENHGLLWCQPNGRPIDPRRDWQAWKELLEAVQIPHARLHDARHTAATLLLIQGVDRRTVMDLLGWSQVSMVARYQHVVDEMKIEAARRMGSALWG